MNEEAADWWRQAQADVSAAAYNVGGGYAYVASWLVQQAVEKALKALLLERGISPQRTHNLRYLSSLVAVPEELRLEISSVDPLFEMTRYPYPEGGIPAERISATDADAHLAAGQKVLRWIENQLPTEPSTPQ